MAGYRARDIAVAERTMVAGIPVYPQVREMEPAGTFGVLAQGNLYLTNQRLVF
jgi:hypothetical protein